jgi:hypothetical protein
MARRVRTGMSSLVVASTLGALTWIGVAPSAEAAVSGRRGLEIEGARDRRGFFAGVGVGFGGTFFWYDDFFPATRVDVTLGGGVSKRFTLGVNLHVQPYLMKKGGVAFGGDIEATGYLFRGLYLRPALGIGGVPRRGPDDNEAKGLTVGIGGSLGIGYEFFLNATAAMGAGFTYDARFIPGSKFPRQTLLVGLRFSWY